MNKKLNTKKDGYVGEIIEPATSSKINNVKAYEYLKELKLKKEINISNTRLEEIHNCGNILKYAINRDVKKKETLYTETCNSRFCERCQKINSYNTGNKIYTIANYLKETKGYDFLFLTLTVKNVKGNELSKEITKINQGVARLFKRNAFGSKIFKASITKMEITYNKKRYDYHPHLHILLAVEKSYFKSDNYLSQEDIMKHWQECFKDKNITQVNIKKVNDFEKSILEISKYEAKSSDMLVNKSVFKTFYQVLSNRKMLRFNREFKILSEAYEEDKYGLFDYFRIPAERVEYLEKIKANYIYKSKTYNTAISGLTDREKEYLENKHNVLDYNEFLYTYNQVKEKRLDLKALIRDIEIKLETEKNKIILLNAEEQLKLKKNLLYRKNSLINIYDFMNTEMKIYFKK